MNSEGTSGTGLVSDETVCLSALWPIGQKDKK